MNLRKLNTKSKICWATSNTNNHNDELGILNKDDIFIFIDDSGEFLVKILCKYGICFTNNDSLRFSCEI